MSLKLKSTYSGRRVLLTGHTGFKGSWLAEWLLRLGAHVTGLSLHPPTAPSLFEAAGLASRLKHIQGDIRDAALVRNIVSEGKFDFVFHLAAQPLVRASYVDPVGTFETNVLGTARLLDAVRLSGCSCVVIVVTTDKCYENREWLHAYREEDALGGHDPYSASKAGAELVVSSWRRSFFSGDKKILVASARAGNVIGPGDWAADRIVPDCIRALDAERVILVRNRCSTRPWQHVLEPLAGYLMLGAEIDRARSAQVGQLAQLCTSFNFGPALSSNRTVADLVEELLKHWPGRWEDRSDPDAPHEAGKLNLAIDRAHHIIGWSPRWDFACTLRFTVTGYRQLIANAGDARQMMDTQIREYESALAHNLNLS